MLNKMANKHLSYVIGLCACAACGDGVVGADPCTGDNVECTALRVQQAAEPRDGVTQIPVQDLKNVKPTWVRDLPVDPFDAYPELSEAYKISDHIRLTRDQEGNLWLFAIDLEADALRVSRLDDEGEVIQSRIVPVPDGAFPPSKAPVVATIKAYPAFSPTLTTEQTPSATLDWPKPCPPTTPDGGGGCWYAENIIFDNGLDHDPLRVALSREVQGTFVNDRDEVFSYSGSAPSLRVTKLDREQRELWSQSDFMALGKGPDVHAVALASGRVAIASLADLGNDNYHTFMSLTWTVETDGKVTLAWASSEELKDAPYALLASGDTPISLFTDTDGDLTVRWIKQDSRESRAIEFQRQEYSDLDVRTADVDPDGTVFLLTTAGQRDNQQQALCHAANSGKGGCVALAVDNQALRARNGVENIVTRQGGVVLARAGGKLLRFDLGD